MRMTTYIARRALQVPAVVIGVVTITFVLFSNLPPQYQMISHFGSPSPKVKCGYQESCTCATLNPTSVVGNTCYCIDPPIKVTPLTQCANPIYKQYYDRLGLNQPIYVQWASYVYRTFTFNWGSVSNSSFLGAQHAQLRGVPVVTAISWELPYTLELAVISLWIILAISIPLGNASAVYRNRPIDQSSRLLSFSGFAFPAFLLGNLLILGLVLLISAHSGFFVKTPWCPNGNPLQQEITYSLPRSMNCYSNLPFGASYPPWIGNGIHSTPTGFLTADALIHHDPWLALDSLVRIIVPAFVIAFGVAATLLRFVRNSMLEVMNLDFVRTARAGGVPESRVVSRHAGRNSLNVTVTVLGLTFAAFLGGFPVVEDVFHLNGIGTLLAWAVNPQPALDFAMVFGGTILFTYIVVVANLVVDLLYAYLDPRVRLG